MKTEIRQLTPDDIPVMYDYCREFYEESNLDGVFDQVVFEKNWRRLMEIGAGGVLGAWARDNRGNIEFAGAVAGILCADLCTGEEYAQEVFLFVTKRHRTGVGLKLFLAFEKWSRDSGVKRIHFGSRLDIGERFDKLLMKRGYEPVEKTFRKRF